MTKNVIDARGQPCPKPLIATKNALNDDTIGEIFSILIDNETSKENVERFLKDNNIKFQTSKTEDSFIITVSKSGKIIISSPEEYCTVPVKKEENGKHVICIKNDKMGFGPDELGSILIKGFINTIKEIKPLPEKIIFYNTGVNLTVKDSQVINSLTELEEMGTTILVCGTCADYFNIKKKVAVGTISNMYDITESLTKASKVIYP